MTNVKDLSEKELKKLQKDVEAALVKRTTQKRAEARKAAEATAAKYGFTLAELVGGKPSKTVGKAKYRNPANAGQTWTGRGRQPGWIKDALAAGKSLEDMAI